MQKAKSPASLNVVLDQPARPTLERLPTAWVFAPLRARSALYLNTGLWYHFACCRNGSRPHFRTEKKRSSYRNAESLGVPEEMCACIPCPLCCGSQPITSQGQELFQGFISTGDLPATLASVHGKYRQENIQDNKSRMVLTKICKVVRIIDVLK